MRDRCDVSDGSRDQLIARLSAKLDEMAGLAGRVQSALGAALPAGFAPSSGVAKDLQQIDRLQQTLEDLARVTRALSEERGEQVHLPRLAALARLHDVSVAIAGRAAEEEDDHPGAGVVTLL